MSNFSDAIVRAAAVSSVAGSVGASIGGSATAVFGPAAVGGAALGGFVASTAGFVGSLCSDLLG